VSLRSRADFQRVSKEGNRARAGVIALTLAPGGDDLGRSRVGLAVATRSGAVTRNRIRRRLKEAVRVAAPSRQDLIVRGDDRVLGLPFQELVENLRSALARAEERP